MGTTLGTADLERGLVHLNFDASVAASLTSISGVSANFESKSIINIEEELLGTPRASK